MEQKNELNQMLEWAVWGNLESKTDLELILLKGHLILDNLLEIVLERNNITNSKNYSFYRKVTLFETIETSNQINKDFILSSLKDINRLRNKIAHEYSFDIENGEFEVWALNILKKLNGFLVI